MSDNIDIRIREDGARVVSRNLEDIANSSDKADKSVKNVNKTLSDTGKSSSGLDRLKKALDQTNISLQQAFDSSRVERFNQGLVQYRNGLMKHFEMISKGARASAAAIKSQMEALTASPVGLTEMSNYYKEQERSHSEMVAAIAADMTRHEQIEKSSSARRLASASEAITSRQALEEGYSAFWIKELGTRDRLEQQSLVDSVKNLKLQEEAESRSYQQRIKFAGQAIAERMKEESAYTTWWLTEIKKRESATAASNLKTAQQRSGLQSVNAERLDRGLIAPAQGTSEMSKFYAAQGGTQNNARTALQTAEVQAMQRQMAMMQLLLPMAERQNMLDVQGTAAAEAHAAAKARLTDHNTRLASATRISGDSQAYWNAQSKDAHALARGLSGSLGQLWLTYGSILPLLTGAALGSAFVGAAKSGSDLAYQLTFVKALGGESADAISKLKDQAHELGTQGVFGPKELASGYRVLAQAGMDATQSLALMPDVINLATVGELKMDQAGLAIVGTLNAFRLGVDQSSKVSDMFAKAAAVSQSSVEDLTQAMRYASTTSTQYKQGLEDTMTALTLLAKVNITGTSAGTAYRNMLKEIYTPTEKAKKAWSDLGIKMTEVVDGKEKVRGFVDIMYDLQKVIQNPKTGYTEKGQMNIIGDLFGERGSKEAAEMLTIVKSRWMELRNEIANSNGFGQNVAGKLNDTVKVSWASTMNTLESELEKAFDKMDNGFGEFAARLKGLFQSDDFRSTLDSLVSGVVTLGNAFLKAAPYLLDFAKAWVVLKAAQLGASIASLMLAAATAAQGLAAGMLAASGAMGPVAAGAGVVSSAIAAMGGPLTLILSLLAAGAVAWFVWGQNAETASGKAIKTAEEKLKALKEQNMSPVDRMNDKLAAEQAELDKLQEIYNLRNKTMGLDRAHVDEARKAFELQGKVVAEMEKGIKIAKDQAKVQVPVVPIPNVTPAGPKDWNSHKETHEGAGPSGRLGKDDNALAKLQAQLQASEKEYAVIMMTGDAQFKLNEGQSKALEIQQKITELKSRDLSELKDKGIKQHNDQLSSLEQQLTVANDLGKQLQANELLKVNNKLDEEVRMSNLLPQARELENKFISIRNELLQKGVVLDATTTEELRKRLELQMQLSKTNAARDQFVNNGGAQQEKNFQDQVTGLKDAQGSQGWTQNDTDKSAMGLMGGMGIDVTKMQEQRTLDLAQLDAYYQRINQMRSEQLISEEQYQSARMQLSARSNQVQMAGMDQFFGGLATLQNSSNKKLGAIGKAAAIAQATMQGVVAVQNALAVQPYYLGMALAVGAGVSAAANVAKIAGVNFATGGSFVVGGSGGVDSQQVSMRASPGERITVATPTQVRKGDEYNKKNQGNSSNTSDGNNIKIVNVVDPNMLQDYLSTPAGERVLVNTIQRNATSINSVLRG